MSRALAALALCLSLPACAVWDRAVADYVIERQERVQSYEGTYVEKGSIPGHPDVQVRGRVRFVAPAHFFAEVLEPADYRGDAVAYDGSHLWLYSARTNSGIHVRNVPWSQERWRDWMYATIRANRSAYDLIGDEEKVTLAGRVAQRWRIESRIPGIVSSRWWMDDEFTTTLRLDAGDFSFKFEEVSFNRPLVTPDFDPPPEAAWFEWDMAAPSVSMEEVKQFTDFKILEPGDDCGLERTKTVWPRTDVAPIIALYYERGPFYASVAEIKDEGFADPKARGVDVDLGDTKGRLAGIGWMSILWFSRAGVQVTVISNLPLHELVAFGKSLRPR
ncbi:MAG: outer membrane lipoprotein carrier protein LolA [Planctomycetota bacterium]